MSNYYEGQKVVCISESFPVHATTEVDKSIIGNQAPIHPVKGETLVIDEILGDFFRFDKYDSNESFNWWHCTRFRPLDDFIITESVESEMQCVARQKQIQLNVCPVKR